MTELSKKKSAFFVLVYLIFSIMAYLSVGSYDSRLANSIGDDHPVVWARFVANSNFWKSDGGYALGRAFAIASLPNLLASFSAKFHEQFPIWLSWIYILIQNVGLAIALFVYCRCFLKDDKQSFLVTVLCFLIAPWGLNLAYYPSMMYTPYPGHLVMPFLVFAAVFLIQNKNWLASLILIPAALIHPSQTLHFVCLATFYSFIASRKDSFKSLWPMIFPILSCFIIPLVLKSGLENPLTDSELISSAINNPHLVPWHTSIFWPWSIPTMIMIFGLSFVLMRTQTNKERFFQPFWWANFLSCIFMAALHVVGVKLKILPIILLCPLRITVINSVLLLPLIIFSLLDLIWNNKRAVAVTSLTLLMLILFSKRGLFWGPLLILAFSKSDESKRPRILSTGVLITVWWTVFLLAGRPARMLFGEDMSALIRNILAPGISVTFSQILIAISLGSLLLLFLQLGSWSVKKLVPLLLVLVTAIGIIQAKNQGAETLKGPLKSMLELQRWANTETPKESIFLIEGSLSWRGISERRAFPASAKSNGLLPYMRNREPVDLSKRVNEVYSYLGKSRFEELDADDIKVLARELRSEYLVERSSQKSKQLPVVFENDLWRVYKVNEAK